MTKRLRRATVAVAGLAALTAGTLAVPVVASADGGDHQAVSKHVLLLSVDGLHQSDLQWYATTHPGSALAHLVQGGADYLNARTPFPSDSFPGMVAQVTGGNPSSTGIYYDDTYNHALLPAGTTSCAGVTPGAEVAMTEAADLNLNSIDAGQGLVGLPGSILQMTGQPQTVINPANLPVDPTTCTPVYPNQYLEVNTIFEVAKAHGMGTAWSDKHPAYSIFDGPSGTGVDDLFTPEINSIALGFPVGDDWTKDNLATQEYDNFKVDAVLNEIDGYDHGRTAKVGVPAIFGMNFQTISTAQKLPTSDAMTGGYLSGGTVPGPLLSNALDFVNREVGTMLFELWSQHLLGTTTVILSAKHGQSPTDPTTLARVPDGPVISALDAAWTAAHPGAGPLVAFSTDDDGMLLWLSDRSRAAADFARQFLLSTPAAGNDVDGNPLTVTASGLSQVYAGSASAQFFGVPLADPRHPDLVGIAQHGVVYTGGQGKIAEHGGDDPQDRHVALVVFGAGVRHPSTEAGAVETTEIAPTILRLLGLDPGALRAVQEEHTPVLAGLDH